LSFLFGQCDGIRNLRLELFDFGDDPAAIPQAVKDRFSRLSQLDLIKCRGSIRMFIENTPAPKLRMLDYWSEPEAADEEEIMSALASGYLSLSLM
jgi:hypothetical protein